MSKKLATILFITVLSAPPLVAYTWLQVFKSSLKCEIKYKLSNEVDEDQLLKLMFSKKASEQLNWEHAKEFEYQGEMYDVVRQVQNGDSITYYCWLDNEETDLNQQLSKLINEILGTSPEKEKQQDLLISYFKSVYFHETFSWTPIVQAIDKVPSGHNPKELIISNSAEIPTPPPQI